MTKEKEIDVRCMALSFATAQCPGMHPDIVLDVARQYLRFVLGAKADLRVVANDDKSSQC